MGPRTRGVKLTGVMVIKKASATYYYLRRRGKPLIPLPQPNGDPARDPAFLSALAEARKTKHEQTNFQIGTFGRLCEAALASNAYHGLSAGYRRTISTHIGTLRAAYGTLPLRQLQDTNIDHDVRRAANPTARRKVWRFLCTFAVEAGHLERDPSLTARKVKAPKTEGHDPWTPDDIAAYREKWGMGTPARAAFELLFWTGARISDAVRLGPRNVGPDGVLAYQQSKTGGWAYVPWSCAIPAYVPDPKSRTLMFEAIGEGATFLATTTGATRSVNGLGNMIREAAREAGVEKSAHGLRKARAIHLAEGGGTPHQIGAWTGHETLKEVSRYTAAMDRRKAVIG